MAATNADSDSDSITAVIAVVEGFKKEGNDLFQKAGSTISILNEAMERYQSGVNKVNQTITLPKIISKDTQVKNQMLYLKVTLLSNMAMCSLKKAELELKLNSNNNSNTDIDTSSLQTTIEYVTTSLQSLDQITSEQDTRPMRSKLLYRRSKANFLMTQTKSANNSNSKDNNANNNTNTNNNNEIVKQYASAQTDLQQLLSFDTHNKSAQILLRQIKVHSAKMLQTTGMASSATHSPLTRALNHLQQHAEEEAGSGSGGSSSSSTVDAKEDISNGEKFMTSLKFIHASLLDDLVNAVHELLGNDGRGIEQLLQLAFPPGSVKLMDTDNDVDNKDDDANEKEMYRSMIQNQGQALALQCLSSASALPVFALKLHRMMLIMEQDTKCRLDDYVYYLLVNSSNRSNSNSSSNSEGSTAEELVNAIMALQMRLMLYMHVVEDDIIYNRDASASEHPSSPPIVVSILSNKHQARVCNIALQSQYDSIKSMALNCLSAWLEPNPLPILQSIHAHQCSSNKDSTAKNISYGKAEPTEEEVRQMQPRKLAEYRKRCYQRTHGRRERCRRNALYFANDNGNGDGDGGNAIDSILSFVASSLSSSLPSSSDEITKIDGYWRKEYVITVGRIMNHIRDENARESKKDGDDNGGGGGGVYIDDTTRGIIQSFFDKTGHQLTIEEIIDLSPGDVPDRNGNNDNDGGHLFNCIKNCLFITSLLLASNEVGSWGMKECWKDSRNEWETLASSGNHDAMAVAAECASAAAGVEGFVRSWIQSCINPDNTSEDGAWRRLLSCDNREVRSGAASAMAKLGLADKSVASDEGELIALLEVAAGLLEDDGEGDENNDEASTSKMVPATFNSSSSGQQAPVERGVELLTYLSSKTSIKDEIAHGFALTQVHSYSPATTASEKTVLERLVELSEPKNKKIPGVTPAVAFSLATTFASLSVSIETLRNEAFAEKEITSEQFDQIQAMGKTEEEAKLEESKKEKDNSQAVSSRIKSMARHNVPRALVSLMEMGEGASSASNATLEQVVIAMMRFAGEASIRGAMIQQGCLSACINFMKNGELSETEKKIMRHGQHTIAKMLVTTNPSLLNTSQCMGSIKPLILLVRDTDSSDLQRFEALLSLTNLASHSDSTKQRIISEKGIGALSYAMFSSHELVRKAATEAMTNLVPHPKIVDHLRENDNLKVWVAFSCDFDEHFECARAALGCLAMVTQDRIISSEMCKMKLSKGLMKDVLESGNLELMHRLLIIVLNLMEHGGACLDFIIETGTVAFCEVYAQSYQDGSSKTSELNFSPADKKLMDISVALAKEVVSASNK